jgi:hypothetical protein
VASEICLKGKTMIDNTDDVYVSAAQMEQMRRDGLLRVATPGEKWLHQQLDRIAPDRGEQGCDGADTKAMQALVFELKELADDLLKAGTRLLSSDSEISEASDDELRAAEDDHDADMVTREQAAAVLDMRGAIKKAVGVL